MTLKLESDLDIQKMYPHTENEAASLRHSNFHIFDDEAFGKLLCQLLINNNNNDLYSADRKVVTSEAQCVVSYSYNYDLLASTSKY